MYITLFKRHLITRVICKSACFLAASVYISACSENEYLLYDTKQKDSVFFSYKNEKDETDSILTYRFDYDIADEHTVDIPVTLMGMPHGDTRKIDIEAVKDSTDMVAGKHYIIESAELPAHAITSSVKIKLLRNKDPQLKEREFKIRLAINENNDLRPTGARFFTIRFSDIRPDKQPDWWSSWAPLPEYSFEAAQVFFEYFYKLAPQANRDVFDEMAMAYGKYFVNAKDLKGPMALYDRFLIRYVLIPMYEETGDRFKWQRIPSM